ncbi:serine hydrolase domain-containing protein [Streptomyces indonesiensis]
MPIRSHRRLIHLAIALLIASTAWWRPATAHATTPSHPTLNAASIDAYVNAYMERTDLPGAVVAVTRGDKVVHAAGYGHTAAGKAMTARTPVPVASLSKSMTALAVMRLVEEGRVDLDQPPIAICPSSRWPTGGPRRSPYGSC